MYLQSLELKNFRNFPSRRFEFSPEVNIVYGPNASGKTNLLEAIYMLSNLRSFRTHLLRNVIQWDHDQAYVRGRVYADFRQSGDSPDSQKHIRIENRRSETSGKMLAVKIESGAKTAFLNAKSCRSSREYLQVLPSTAFIPDDLDLVKGMPASRRYFLDKGTFQFYPSYWSLLTEYNKIVQQKNALLRKLKEEQRKPIGEEHPCEIWNEQLQHVGSKVILHRMRFVEHLRKKLNGIYSQWLENKETVDVRYKSSVKISMENFPRLFESTEKEQEQGFEWILHAYKRALQENLDRESRLGTAVIGPHRDDLEIKIWGKALRAFGSQGQQRTAVLALKLAEVYVYFDRYGEYSILLLDDVTSELDDQRSQKLFEYVQHGMQVFISTTTRPDLPVDRSLSCAYFDLSA